jgi:hypothetical protein
MPDSDAAVMNGDGDLAGIGPLVEDPDLAGAVFRRGDGFRGVDDQVQEDLSELDRIAEHGRQADPSA